MDGLTYTDVSINMMSGEGSIWSPKYTEVWNPFYEHPPLAYATQATVLSITGAPLWGDALYGIVCFILVFIAIVKSFRFIAKSNGKSDVLPLLLFLSCPIVWWSIGNNILENTLMVFTTWASYYLISNIHQKTVWRPLLAGMLVAAAFLSKGFTGLFPISLPFLLMFLSRPYDFRYFLRETFTVIVGLGVIMGAILIDNNALAFFENYMNQQVIRSLSGIQTVNSRFDILLKFLLEILPMLVVFLSISIYKNIKNKTISNSSWFWVLTIYSLCPVLPICVSLKQGAFYILAAYPIVALAMALWLYQNIELKLHAKWHRPIIALVFLGGLGNVAFHFNKLGAHADMINEVDDMAKTIEGTVACDHETYVDWSFQTYLYRRHGISLDNKNPYDHDFLILVAASKNSVIPNYSLYKDYGKHVIFKRHD